MSHDGISWFRGYDVIEGARGADAAADVGSVMSPNQDWWTFDTYHLAPADVQVSQSIGQKGHSPYIRSLPSNPLQQ